MFLLIGILLITLTSIMLFESIGAQSKYDEFCAIECREPVTGKYKFCC